MFPSFLTIQCCSQDAINNNVGQYCRNLGCGTSRCGRGRRPPKQRRSPQPQRLLMSTYPEEKDYVECPFRGKDFNTMVKRYTDFQPQETNALLDVNDIEEAATCSANRYNVDRFQTPTLGCGEFETSNCAENDDLFPKRDESNGGCKESPSLDQTNDSASQPTPVSTPKPIPSTTKPMKTDNPTPKPQKTDRPTDKPVKTDHPTPRPQKTDRPTDKPVKTDHPTARPQKTDRPTDKPVKTDHPTPRPQKTHRPTDKPVKTDHPTPRPQKTDRPTDKVVLTSSSLCHALVGRSYCICSPNSCPSCVLISAHPNVKANGTRGMHRKTCYLIECHHI
jgi:hypothetical protein